MFICRNSPTQHACITGCRPRKPLDIVFAIESKSKLKTLARDVWEVPRGIISELDMDDDAVNVRILHECAAMADLEIKQFLDKNALMESLDNIGPMSSAQLLEAMAEAIKQDGDHHSNGTENGRGVRRRKIGIYVTDGESGDFETTVGAAQRVKFDKDVELFAIGVGHNINPTELRAVASCDVSHHFYSIRGHSKSTAVSRKLGKYLCLGR